MEANENEGCFPLFIAADVLMRVMMGRTEAIAVPLRSSGANGVFDTHAKLHVELSDQGHLSVIARFEFDGVALPYNIMAALVTVDGSVLNWRDYTDSCQEVPAALYPGDELTLFAGPVAKATFIRAVVFGR